jgi:hypothetical protein
MSAIIYYCDTCKEMLPKADIKFFIDGQTCTECYSKGFFEALSKEEQEREMNDPFPDNAYYNDPDDDTAATKPTILYRCE